MKEIFSQIGNAVIGTTFDGISKLISNFKADPTKVVELQKGLETLQIEAQSKLADIQNEAEKIQAAELETVNQTMRQEATSEHWAQWIWRPFIGFTFCAMVINNYVVMPYFPALKTIAIPSEVYTAMLVILGAASAGRGWMKVEQVKNQNK